jgi:hypothetical protein
MGKQPRCRVVATHRCEPTDAEAMLLLRFEITTAAAINLVPKSGRLIPNMLARFERSLIRVRYDQAIHLP